MFLLPTLTWADLRRRTGFRLGAMLAALVAAGMLAMAAVTYWLGAAALIHVTDRAIEEQLVLLAARPAPMLPFMIRSRLGHNPAVITLVGLYSAGGTLIVGDLGPKPDVPLDSAVHELRVTQPGGTAEHIRVAARRLPDGTVLAVGRNVAELLAIRRGLMQALALGLVPAVLLSLSGGVTVGMRTERRLAAIRAVAARIMAGHLDERLPVGHRGDELDQLCLISNQLLARSEELVLALKAAGENIAHDLRTPLTSVRMRLERAQCTPAAAPALIDSAMTGLDQVLAIVSALLRIAEIEHGRRIAGFARFDLMLVVKDVAETFRILAEEKRIRLVAAAGASVMITGDRDLLTEALVNLVDNAIKFTMAGGEVQVSVAGEPGRPILRVADRGLGIPMAERDAVFRRFYRSETSRTTPGSGLGLNLVAAIAKLHGFGVRISDNAPGCIVEILCWPS